MGRRNKKLAKLQQSQQAREFLSHKESPASFKSLSKEEKRIEIAHTCIVILSNPELQYNKIESILELCYDDDPNIQALSISSLCTVFIDILPGYKIQEHGEDQTILSKEVKAIRIYESSLLKYYEKFIDLLCERNNQGCISCVCRLLESLLHFNYRDKLLDIVVKSICELPALTIPAIRKVLLSNELEFRLHAVLMLEKFVKMHSYKTIPCAVIETLTEINFTALQQETLPKKRPRNTEDQEEDADKKKHSEISFVYCI